MTAPELLTNREIVNLLEKAFLPIRCEATLVDYENRVDLKLLDRNGNVTLTAKGTTTDSLREMGSINELCDGVLVRIRAKPSN